MCVYMCVCMYRFYAGDQVALFAQAHLVHPHKKPPAMSTMMPARLRTTSTSRCGAAASPGHEYICEVCMLSYPQPAMAGLECGHLFCHECWDNYLRVMVVCEGRAQTIACPATACDIVVDEATVLYVFNMPWTSLLSATHISCHTHFMPHTFHATHISCHTHFLVPPAGK